MFLKWQDTQPLHWGRLITVTVEFIMVLKSTSTTGQPYVKQENYLERQKIMSHIIVLKSSFM